MQHEGIGVSAEFGNDEGNPLRHRPCDEGDVAREPIELCHHHRASFPPCEGERRGKLRARVERVRSRTTSSLPDRRCQTQSALLPPFSRYDQTGGW
jgi:hypothetical protein